MTTAKEAGRMGARVRHGKSPEELAAIAKKAAETRIKRDPNAYSKMGKKGGQAPRSKKPLKSNQA